MIDFIEKLYNLVLLLCIEIVFATMPSELLCFVEFTYTELPTATISP